MNADFIKDKDLLCLSDSTSFNLSKRSGRIQDFDKLGVLQDGKTKGFHAHASLALDASNGCAIGLSDLILWNRSAQKAPDKNTVPKQSKESFKWHMGASNSDKSLSSAKSLTFVFDREADDFDLFGHIDRKLKRNFIIRAMQNRQIKFKDKIQRLDKCLEILPVEMTYEVNLRALDHYSWTSGTRVVRKARKATLELRFETLEILPPQRLKKAKSIKLSVVEVKEITNDLEEGEKPLHWILWTNRVIENAQDAKQIVEWYLLRWDIEQLFRIIKKKGFNQEATELEAVDAILKQTTMTFKAAVAVMQLVNARSAENPTPIEYVFDEDQQTLLNKVNEHLEGNTEKLKNPFLSNSLSWASWIIARLGGWKGYQSQRPPGPIIMKTGLDKFFIMFETYQLLDTS